MKNEFPGFYSPSADDYKRLWADAVVILDTNVLLDLYRLPVLARDELLAVLEGLKDRLWLPFQVALEFQRRRLTVIAGERKNTEAALGEARDLVGKLSDKVSTLQIDKYGLGLDPKPLIDDLRRANDKLIAAIESVHQSKLEITSSDSVRDRLDAIFNGKIGPAPKDQEELNQLIADGEMRYAEKISPGWMDADKDKSPNEAHFYHRGIKYSRKFGDLILWKQTLIRAKNDELKSVILVTSDRKPDWWLREQGKTIGPQPDLIEEIYSETGVSLFWMYSSDQFLEHAKKYASAKVSDETVTEVREVSPHSNQTKDTNNEWNRSLDDFFAWMDKNRDKTKVNYQINTKWLESSGRKRMSNLASVSEWTREIFDDISTGEQGIDLVAAFDGEYFGFGVVKIRKPSDLLSDDIRSKVARGYHSVVGGDVSTFTLVVTVAMIPPRALLRSKSTRAMIDAIADEYPGIGVVVGVTSADVGFVPVLKGGAVPPVISVLNDTIVLRGDDSEAKDSF